MTDLNASVSIICVYNNPAVRQECLDRSISDLAAEASGVEFLPIENASGTYPSAGAALNHGVTLAKNDVVVFVHQDVYLHSLAALKRAAAQMRAEGFGMLGAIGMSADSLLVGRIRDRVLLSGVPVDSLTDIDSLDEVLFMAPRAQLLTEPLTESPDLAWHAYAVEYGLRLRRKGLRTGVADIPLTHNSLSVNLDRLDEAHQAVARQYPDMLPVITTCGTISQETARSDRRVLLGRWRWRYRWLRGSIALQRAHRSAPHVACVLADMRHDVDDLIDRSPGKRLYILSSSEGQPFLTDGHGSLELTRRNGVAVFSTCGPSQLSAELKNCPAGFWTLITNLSEADLGPLASQLPATNAILGFHEGTGLWLLVGLTLDEALPGWRSRRATPLGRLPALLVSLFIR